MIFLVGIDLPKVMFFSIDQVANSKHSCEHRMILVIVAMEPIAPDRLIVFEAANEIPHSRQVITVIGIIDRISFRNAKDTAVLNVSARSQTDALEFPFTELDEIGVRHFP